MLIAQITDTHLLELKIEDEVAQLRADNLTATVAAINNLNPAVDFVIHTGDMTHNHAQNEYALAREILSDLHSPLYVVPGNRDSRANLRQAFANDGYLLGYDSEPILYAVNIQYMRLIGFDSLSSASNKGNVDQERLKWLDLNLAEYPDKPTAIIMHHPPIPITTSIYPWQYESLEAGEKLRKIVSHHTQIVRLLCGHSHRPFIASFAGTEVSTVPSIATDLRLDPYPKPLTHVPVFQVHKLEKSSDFFSQSYIANMHCQYTPMNMPARLSKTLDQASKE
ncbi:MAG: hypothetical protein CMF69_08700 [Magnetovibrio sp.]|nr:hypothetical protein [Magnetovibrio sp.]